MASSANQGSKAGGSPRMKMAFPVCSGGRPPRLAAGRSRSITSFSVRVGGRSAIPVWMRSIDAMARVRSLPPIRFSAMAKPFS